MIASKHIRAALDNLLYSTVASKTDQSPLYDLMLVEFIINNNPPLSRSIALMELLTTTIKDAYYHHRRIHNLTTPDSFAKQDFVLQQISEDIQTTNRELICWGWLYHRYVRVDLDISNDLYASMGCFDERTLRRYAAHGVRRLTERVIAREGQMRRDDRRRWLYTHLPIPTPLTLPGRETLLAEMQHLMENIGPRHIQITGETGIGKTSVVQELTRRVIDSEKIDRLVWLEDPESVQYVHDEIKAYCAAHGLRECLNKLQMMVVIDNSDGLDKDLLDDLLVDLGQAQVILIAQHYRPFTSTPAHIPIAEIDEMYAKAFIRMAGGEPEVIYPMAGGNPTKIKEAIAWFDSDQQQSA